MGVLRIGILGAGVVGLTTAAELQKEFSTAEVTVIADHFNEETTSDGAAGIFRPGNSFSGPTAEITSQWIADAYRYYDDLKFSNESSLAGVFQVSGYIFSSKSAAITKNHLIENLVPLYRTATEDELHLCPGTWNYGSFFTTLLIECRRFLPWMLSRFQQDGGRLIKTSISSFQQVSDQFDLVVNCLGMGAKSICDDYKLVPIRGQVLKVKAPWMKTFFYGDYDTYVIPGSETVTLGGCRNYDSYDDKSSPHDTASIWERCTQLVPSLQKAEIVRVWVGLRPHRDPVRVEQEILNLGTKMLKVVHNYGHGGYGVTVAPGTAKYAVKLLKEFHSASHANICSKL